MDAVGRSDSDIGIIWKKAVEAYDQTAEIKLGGREISWTTDEIRKRQEEALDRFQGKRHSGNHLDRARSALARISGFAQCVTSSIGSLASTAFPPAPVIAEALVYVLVACGDVSEKYDKVANFYETISIFFERLSMLENKLPKDRAFPVQLTRVFAAALKICAIAQKFYKDSRAKAFGKALIQRDDDLGSAYDEFSKQMAAFESCVITATLGIASDNRSDTKTLVGMASVHTALLWQLDTKVTNLGDGIAARIVHQLEQLTVTAQGHPSVSGRGTETGETGETSESDSRYLEMTTAGSDSGSRKSVALESVTKWLSPRAQEPLKQRLTEMAHSYIKGTCNWIEKDPTFLKLVDLNGQDRLLLISGGDGTGKSMISFHIYASLMSRFAPESAAARKASVAYFSFSGGSRNLRSLWDMLCYCALQIAQQDEHYRDQLMATIQKRTTRGMRGGSCCEDQNCDNRCWKSLFEAPFKEGSDSSLFLVLDDVDQSDKAEWLSLLKHLREAADNQIQIRVIMTAAEEKAQLLGASSPVALAIPLRVGTYLIEGVKQDLNTFAEFRMRGLPRLSRLSEERRKHITDVVCQEADGELMYKSSYFTYSSDS
jgi:hypothetical protein